MSTRWVGWAKRGERRGLVVVSISVFLCLDFHAVPEEATYRDGATHQRTETLAQGARDDSPLDSGARHAF